MNQLSTATVLVGLALAIVVPYSHTPVGATASSLPSSTPTSLALAPRIPTAFVPNAGQWSAAARFVARFGTMTVRLEDTGVAFAVGAHGDARAPHGAPATDRGAVVRMTFRNGAPSAIVGEGHLPGTSSYILGNDAARWQSSLPRYAGVRYRGLYPGIDLLAYEKDAHFEYDLVLAPRADLAQVEVQVAGAQGLRLEPDGDLVIETAAGPVRQPRPLTVALDSAGARREVACAYDLRGHDRFGFVAPTRSDSEALVVDPGLLYATFLGGTLEDEAYAVHVDGSGVLTVAGRTMSLDFPTTPGAFDTSANGNFDVFVARLDPAQTGRAQLVYATYLGGVESERPWAVHVDDAGITTLAGETQSPDFPTTTNAWDPTHNGSVDAFVVRLNPRGTVQLVYSTYLGGSASDVAWDMAVDAASVITIVGGALSGNFPTTSNAFNRTRGGQFDGFLARFDLRQASNLVYCTLIGASGNDSADGVTVDDRGVATVVGATASTNFPIRGGFDSTLDGSFDAYVMRIDPSQAVAQQMVYSTLFGGSGADSARRVHADANGVVTLGGYTESSDLPLSANAFDRTLGGVYDACVARIDSRAAAAQQLQYATYLGSSAGDDAIYGLAVDPVGVITVGGYTNFGDYPTTPGAFDLTLANHEAVVTRLDPARAPAQQLLYSTFVGGAGFDRAFGLALEPSGAAIVVGITDATDFPTTANALAGTFGGGFTDGFVAHLDMLPTGVRRFGAASAGCAGPLGIGVTSMPSLGNTGFALTCHGAPPNAPGQVLLAQRALTPPVRASGIDLHVDPSAVVLATTVLSTPRGSAELPLSIPSVPALAGLRLYAQFVFSGPASPPPCPPLGFSATSALEIIVQR